MPTARAKIPILIPPGTKLLHLERIPHASWQLWINESPCGRFGTYLELRNDGSIYRVTERGDRGTEEMRVKGADK